MAKYIRPYYTLISTALAFESSRLISVRSKLFVIVFILISEKLRSYNKCQENAKYYQQRQILRSKGTRDPDSSPQRIQISRNWCSHPRRVS